MKKRGRPSGVFKDITGQRQGKLVIDRPSAPTKDRKARWIARCDCGGERLVVAQDFARGRILQCGCLRRATPHRNRGTKALPGKSSSSRLYRIHQGILQRTSNPNNDAWENYGGRGIKLCAEWHTFPAFYEWALSHGYSDSLSIDRIDVNGNYDPGNCRWATPKQQTANRRPPSEWKKAA